MPRKDKEQDDNARRQGQFEGQVLTTLTDIKAKMETFNTSFSGLETRVRTTEATLSTHTEMFKDSGSAHEELFGKIRELAGIVTGLVSYQDRQRGVILAVGIVGPIVSSVVVAIATAIILKLFHL